MASASLVVDARDAGVIAAAVLKAPSPDPHH